MRLERELFARLARSPLFWLGLQAGAIFFGLAVVGDLRSVIGPDTPGFRWHLASGDFHYFLNSKRTFGYPVFLAAVETVTGGDSAVAFVQLALYLGSVVLLGWAAQRFLGSALLAVAAASPLFYFQLLPWLANQVASDLSAAACAVATFALFLRLLVPPASSLDSSRSSSLHSSRARLFALLGFGACLVLTYQTRPSYLFLVPLLPLLGLARTAWRSRPRRLRSALRDPFLGLGLASALPLLLWCTLRWAVVGEFGLVSFAGMNLIGITAPMVSPETVPRLPEELRPFGERLIKRRVKHGLAPLEPEVSYQRWRNEFNRYAHFVSAEALLRTVGGKPGSKQAPWGWANRFYSRYSLAIIRLRPDLYARWLLGASGETWSWLKAEPAMRGGGFMLLLGLLVGLVRRWRGGGWAPSSETVELLALALAWAVAGQLLVIAVEVPLARYNFANFLLLPGALLALAVDFLRPRPQAR